MKTKVALTALMSILLTNVNADQHTFAGDVDVQYTSEYHRRGAIVSQEALQTSVGVTVGVAGTNIFGDIFSSNSLDTGSDSLEGTLGANFGLPGKLDLYAGLYNSNIDASGTTLEGFVGIKADLLLQPAFIVYRDVSDDLYTYEGQLSHTIDLESCELELTGIVGSTDVTVADDVTYYAGVVKLTKSIRDNVDIYADTAFSDTDDRDQEWIWGAGLTVKF